MNYPSFKSVRFSFDFTVNTRVATLGQSHLAPQTTSRSLYGSISFIGCYPVHRLVLCSIEFSMNTRSSRPKDSSRAMFAFILMHSASVWDVRSQRLQPIVLPLGAKSGGSFLRSHISSEFWMNCAQHAKTFGRHTMLPTISGL